MKEAQSQFPPNGVDGTQLFNQERRYSINGEPVTREEAHAALELVDDSARWNLTAVGDSGFLSAFKADLHRVHDLANKLNVKTYATGAWQMSQFNLISGVTLRKPAVGRVGADVGSVPAGNYTAAKLSELFTLAGWSESRPDLRPQPLLPRLPLRLPVRHQWAQTDPAPVVTGDNSILVILAIAAAGAFLI